MTLRVTVEIVPFGDEANKRVLSVLNIHNRGYLDAEKTICGYDAAESPIEGPIRSWNKIQHKRADGFWMLILKTLLARDL